MSLKDNILEWTKNYEKHEFDIDLNKLRNIFMNIIIKFIINENCHNTCIKYLNNKERKYIHELAGGCGLETCSRGKKNRKIFINKPNNWKFDNTKFICIDYHKHENHNKTKYNNSLSKEDNNLIRFVEDEINRIDGYECDRCDLKLTKENILDGFYLAHNLYQNEFYCCNCLERMPISPYKEEIIGIYTEDLEKYKFLMTL
jgi:hypothetical protein